MSEELHNIAPELTPSNMSRSKFREALNTGYFKPECRAAIARQKRNQLQCRAQLASSEVGGKARSMDRVEQDNNPECSY